MTLPKIVLHHLPYSPYSGRVKWCFSFLKVPHQRIEFIPTLSEIPLALKLRVSPLVITVPVAEFHEVSKTTEYLMGSWEIVNRVLTYFPEQTLIPSTKKTDVQKWNEWSDQTIDNARPLVLIKTSQSRGALLEALGFLPKFLRPFFIWLGHIGVAYFIWSFGLKVSREKEYRSNLKQHLSKLNEVISKNPSAPLLGEFSYADITVMSAIQSISPINCSAMKLGPETMKIWSEPELAKDFPLLVQWRNEMMKFLSA